MLVGQSGTIVMLGSSGCVMPQLKHAGLWLAKDMLPCRYVTPRSLAAWSSAGLDAPSPWSTGGDVSSFGLGFHTPRPEYSGVFSVPAAGVMPTCCAMVRLL